MPDRHVLRHFAGKNQFAPASGLDAYLRYHHGHDGMGRADCLCSFTIQPKDERLGLTGKIENYNGNFSVLIQKSRGQQRVRCGRTDNSLCAGPDKLREMTDIVIGIHVIQFPGPGVGMNGRKTIILNMVWPALFIQQDIPIRPAFGAIIEIVDH